MLQILGFLGAIALVMGGAVAWSNLRVASVGKGLDELARRRGWTLTIDEDARWRLSGEVDGLPFVVEAERPRKNASRFEMQPHRTRFVARGATSRGVLVLPRDAPDLALGGKTLAALVLFGKEFEPVFAAPEVPIDGAFDARFVVRASAPDEASARLGEPLRAGLLAWAADHPKTPAFSAWVGDEAVLTTGIVLTRPEDVERFVELGRKTVR